eukprot:1150699-Pelagomonas_calceolata.AAC.1
MREIEYHLTERPRTMLWLTNAYALPGSMYACQIWDIRYLKKELELTVSIMKHEEAQGAVTHPSNYRMLAVSNTLYHLCTNALRSMVQDWPQHLTATFYLEAPEACSSNTSTSRLPTFMCHLY